MTDDTAATSDGRLFPTIPFDTFITPHLDVMFRVARSLCNNTHDAEDLVQDALVRAFNGYRSFDGRYPRAWLLTIVRNTNINRHRRQRPVLLRDNADAVGEADHRNPPAPSAEHEATAALTPTWVTDALGRLSPRHLEVVQLVDIGGLTYDEAAAAIGVPVGTVMSRLHRARHRMRAELVRHPDFRSQP